MRYILLLLPLLGLIGCSPYPFRVEAVEGTVTLDGELCADAVLTFVPEDPAMGKAAYARTDEKGFYKLTAFNGGKSGAGTKTGKYIVSVLKEVPERAPSAKELAAQKSGIMVEIPNRSVVPIKYNDAKTSGLTAKVVKGKNVFNFDLTSN